MSVLLYSPAEQAPLIEVHQDEPGLILPDPSVESLPFINPTQVTRTRVDLSFFQLSNKKFIALLGGVIIVISLIFLSIFIYKKIF